MAENLLAEGHPARRLFGSMLRRIAALPMPAGQVEAQTGADWMTKEAGDGKVREELARKRAVPSLGVPGRGRTGPFVGRRAARDGNTQRKAPTEAVGCILAGGREGKMEIPAEPSGLHTKRKGSDHKMAGGALGKQSIVGISVRLELNSKDGLRRVIFTLSKDNLPKNKVQWKIKFELFERQEQSEEFVKLIGLDVDVTTENNKNAELVVKRKKLTVKQSAHAIGTAADLAKAAANQEVPEDLAQESAEETLAQ